MSDARNIVVVGAGIVGVQLARALQRDGLAITLIDKLEPGRGTSFGNAGFIATDEIFPLAHGRIVKSIPRWLLDPLGPLSINTAQIPLLIPWFYRYISACTGRNSAQNIKALASLQGSAGEAWRDILKREKIDDLMRHNGAYKVFETRRGFEETAAERTAQTQYGIPWETRSAEELFSAYPELSRNLYAGIYYPEGMHTINPFDLTQAIFKRFTGDGGTFIRGEVQQLLGDRSHVTGVVCDGQILHFDDVVVAAGYLSGTLLSPLGYRVPMAAERGYHVEVSHDECSVDAPMGFHERGFYVTPMTTGLRLAGTSEFTSANTDPTPRWKRAEILRRHFDELFPEVANEETHRWMGRRPTLPDFLPALGRAADTQNLYLAFGHQHLGLTLSAVTARLLCDLIQGRSTSIDLSPFALTRFQ